MTAAPRAFDLARIGRGLAVDAVADELAAVLAHGGAGAAAVVQAPPGSGKTTLVPPLVAAALSADPDRRIIVTQPRRVAARAAARRLASLDGSRLGERVGFAIGGERVSGRGVLVEFVTPGVLLRRLLADPGLDGVAAVVLDEVHERALDSDLALGLLGEVRELRDDLALVAMSATLDAARFARLLGASGASAPIVVSPATAYPLEVRWAPPAGHRLDARGVVPGFLDHVADTALAAHADLLRRVPEADALVFVPGAREVARVARRLRERGAVGGAAIEVLELEGRASSGEQDRAIAGRDPGGAPRIIVSTSIAESSLTVPGVRLVVDAGLARAPKRDAARGMSGLVTVSASRASSDQRAGRAARQGPGVVVRCFDERAFAAAPAHPAPEIASADLVDAALVLACWGAPGGAGLALPDPPPRVALDDAHEALRELGAIGDDGRATDLGHRLAAVPADPRFARALLEAAPHVGARAAALAVAVASGDARVPGGDLDAAVSGLLGGRERLDGRLQRVAERLERHADRAVSETGRPRQASTAVAGFVVAHAFPSRVARLVGGTGTTYLLASGTRANLPPGSALAGAPWLAVAEVTRAEGRVAEGAGAVIRSAARIDEALALQAAGALVDERVVAVFDEGRVAARRERRLGAIVRSSTPVAASADAGGREAVAAALASSGLDAIGWSDDADLLRRRLALLHRELGEPWPDVTDAALLARLDDWLSPEIDRLAEGTPASRIDLAEPLLRVLPWPEAARLDELVPERLEVPSGSRVRIEYPAPGADGRPVVAVKLQECFGWAQTPRLADERAPVLFHLLSPAGRPLAVTDDLASFWSGAYAQVRAEMRGRYPKHPWPEDPWSHVPTARTKRRL